MPQNCVHAQKTRLMNIAPSKAASSRQWLQAKPSMPTMIWLTGGHGEFLADRERHRWISLRLNPVWLGFKGGKGVATSIGILFGLAWPLGLIFLAVWLAIALLFKTSSISALTASALSPVWAYALDRSDLIAPLAILAALIWFMH